jgi:aminoglycoside/choline kinase family phosphotransferase
MSMLTDDEKKILATGLQLLVAQGIITEAAIDRYPDDTNCQRVPSDGSTRIFLRVHLTPGQQVIIAAPAACGRQELAEARSGWLIGTHLLAKKLRIPYLYGFDAARGVLVFGDLGDRRLHDLWLEPGTDREEKLSLLKRTTALLVELQTAGAVGFDPDWCWDTPCYDESVMLQKEAHYFYRAFWLDLLDQEEVPGLAAEFEDLVGKAARAPAGFFLHRDFQSRNLMIKNGEIFAIDYQAGRLGPLGYDLASLLIDPYMALPVALQEELYAYYVQLLQARWGVDAVAFHEQFQRLALQRNLQILGAFAYLSKVRGKKFFRCYIEPAARMLSVRLAEHLFTEYPLLRKTAATAVDLLARSSILKQPS